MTGSSLSSTQTDTDPILDDGAKPHGGMGARKRKYRAVTILAVAVLPKLDALSIGSLALMPGSLAGSLLRWLDE
jgi:hypothetical protein